MAKGTVTLIKGDSIGVETDYRDALPVNYYAVKRKILGAQGYMLSYPGLTKLGDGLGVDRGANYNERFKEQYRVSDQKLIKIDILGNVTTLGDITGTDQATLIDLYSFNTQGIIAGGNFYLYSPSGGFNQVTDPDLGNPIDGVWVDGYYFLTDGEYIYHSDLTDETSFDGLKFATAEFMPDPSLGLAKTQDNKVIVFGRYTIEYFVNVASENFAFQRVETRAQKIGIVSTHAKCESGGKHYITGGRRDEAVGVHIVSLGSAEKVSTREIDKILKQYSEPDLADMRMEARTEDDVTFILIHLPNETLCFNESIAKSFGKGEAWSILKSDVSGTTPYRAINGVFDARSAKWVYGDKQSTNIGILDNNKCDHYGDIVESIINTPFMDLEKMSVDEVFIETIPGHTADTNAKVAFSQSYDGVTHGTEYWMEYGEPNDYNKRFFLRQLGYVNDWVSYKFRSASKSRMAFAIVKMEFS